VEKYDIQLKRHVHKPTWVRNITCWHCNWILQSSSGQK